MTQTSLSNEGAVAAAAVASSGIGGIGSASAAGGKDVVSAWNILHTPVKVLGEDITVVDG